MLENNKPTIITLPNPEPIPWWSLVVFVFLSHRDDVLYIHYHGSQQFCAIRASVTHHMGVRHVIAAGQEIKEQWGPLKGRWWSVLHLTGG